MGCALWAALQGRNHCSTLLEHCNILSAHATDLFCLRTRGWHALYSFQLHLGLGLSRLSLAVNLHMLMYPATCTSVSHLRMTPGDSEADQAARARLQGGDLLQSDMAAFKAANPACQLADFVRWHSPKDWLHDPSYPQGGHVSDRMSHQVSLQDRSQT